MKLFRRRKPTTEKLRNELEVMTGLTLPLEWDGTLVAGGITADTIYVPEEGQL